MVNISTLIANALNFGGTRSTKNIKYIVIHYTGNDGDTDTSNAKYFKNNVTKTSAHYFVDSDSITQSVRDDRIAYSVGGGLKSNLGATFYKKCTNTNSISIELCDDKKDGKLYPSAATIANAVELTKLLMKKYNVPANNVIRHFDVNGKKCPAYWCGNAEKDKLWETEFKNKLTATQATNTGFSYAVKVTASTLNVRKEASASSAKVIALNKGSIQLIDKEQNGWGHLANNAGWIYLKYTQRV